MLPRPPGERAAKRGSPPGVRWGLIAGLASLTWVGAASAVPSFEPFYPSKSLAQKWIQQSPEGLRPSLREKATELDVCMRRLRKRDLDGYAFVQVNPPQTKCEVGGGQACALHQWVRNCRAALAKTKDEDERSRMLSRIEREAESEKCTRALRESDPGAEAELRPSTVATRKKPMAAAFRLARCRAALPFQIGSGHTKRKISTCARQLRARGHPDARRILVGLATAGGNEEVLQRILSQCLRFAAVYGPGAARRDVESGVRTPAAPNPRGMAKRVGPEGCQTFEGLFGDVTISSKPRSTIYVGNRKLGETPLAEVRLPAGCHIMKAVNQELEKEKVVKINVHANKTTRYRFTL